MTIPVPKRYSGIARLAAESPRIRERGEVEYFALQSRTALNREASGRMPFAWTLNPYRGCEFACKYCYARYTHEFMELRDGRDFERKIFAKVDMPDLLLGELKGARDKGLPIALGTATDPYQPAERHYRITRRLLEAFLAVRGLELSVTTKSALILRDQDLLRRLDRRHRLTVHMTVTTMDARLARLLEPKAPPPLRRIAAVGKLAAAGVYAGVNLIPVVPGITDSRRSLETVAQAAAGVGAGFLAGGVLFLSSSAMRQFMPLVEKEFPHLAEKYRRAYSRSAYLSSQGSRGNYNERIGKLVAGLRRRYGLEGRREEREACCPGGQMELDFCRSASSSEGSCMTGTLIGSRTKSSPRSLR